MEDVNEKTGAEEQEKSEGTQDVQNANDKSQESEGGDYTPESNVEGSEEKANEEQTLDEAAVFSFLSEKTGREITSLDNLIEEKVVEKELSYASEQVAELDRFIKETGRSINDWNELQKDYSSMSPVHLVKSQMRKEYPTLSEQQIELLFQEKYHLDNETYEDSEIALAEAKLARDSSDIVTAHKKLQEEYRKPVTQPEVEKSQKAKEDKTSKPVTETQQVQDKLKELNKRKEKFVTEHSEFVDTLETIQVGDFNIPVDDEIKGNLKDSAGKLETFFPDNFRKEDGSWDRGRLNTFLYLAQSGVLDAVIGNIGSTLKSEGKSEVIQTRKNLDMKGVPLSSSGSEKSPAQQKEEEDFKSQLQTLR